MNKVYRGITRNLAGKSTKGISPEKVERYEYMLHDINMGYVKKPNERKPHDSVKFFKAENQYNHPLSIYQVFKRYGYNNLSDLMPLDVYLTLPASIVDDALDGLASGKTTRMKHDSARTPPEEKLTAENIEKVTDQMVRELGKK